MSEVLGISISAPERVEVTCAGDALRRFVYGDGPGQLEARIVTEFRGMDLESTITLSLNDRPELAAHVKAIRDYIKDLLRPYPIGSIG